MYLVNVPNLNKGKKKIDIFSIILSFACIGLFLLNIFQTEGNFMYQYLFLAAALFLRGIKKYFSSKIYYSLLALVTAAVIISLIL